VAARLDAACAQLQALEERGAEVVPPRRTRIVPEMIEPEEAEASAEAGVAAGSGLAEGYAVLERLVAERGLPPGSLDELVGAPEEAVVPIQALAPAAPEEEGVVPIEALAPSEPEEMASLESPAAAEPEIVPIEDLLYGGSAALKRAVALRQEIEDLLAGHDGASLRLPELLREVFDLVELGLGARR
jgi:hypothetical protein